MRLGSPQRKDENSDAGFPISHWSPGARDVRPEAAHPRHGACGKRHSMRAAPEWSGDFKSP